MGNASEIWDKEGHCFLKQEGNPVCKLELRTVHLHMGSVMSGMEVLGQNDRRTASGWGGVERGWDSLRPQQGILLFCAPLAGQPSQQVFDTPR